MNTIFHIQPSLFVIGLLASLFLLSNCGTSTYPQTSNLAPSQQIDRSNDKDLLYPNEEFPTTLSWLHLLQQVPAVSVRGQGENLTVRIRGAASLNLTTEPLYVVDGIALGHNFTSLARIANPWEVKSIYVVKGAEATIYGTRGANGAIVVTLK